MTVSTHFIHMKEAIALAQQAYAVAEVPVGCVIVKDGRVIAKAHNLTRTSCDPTAHAEILCLQEAGRVLQSAYLEDCDLYVTLEPCPMCAGALSWSRIRHLYYGAYDSKSGGVEHGPRVFEHTTCHHAPGITGGMLEEECASIMKNFFCDVRKKS